MNWMLSLFQFFGGGEYTMVPAFWSSIGSKNENCTFFKKYLYWIRFSISIT